MRSQKQYSMEDKLVVIKDFAQSGLTKWGYVKSHPEYKESTLYKWLKRYFPTTTDTPRLWRQLIA